MTTQKVVWSRPQAAWLWLVWLTVWTSAVTVQAYPSTTAPNSGCSRYMTAPSGYLNYSVNKYESPIQCVWNITVASGNVVQLTILKGFRMGYHWFQETVDCRTNTSVSRLEFLQPSGPDGTLESLAILCSSNDRPWPFRSLSNNLVVQLSLTYNMMDLYFSFSAHYTSVGAQDVIPCGEVLNTTEGEFTSPSYPANYTGLLDCQWTIRVDSIYVLYLVIQDLDIPITDTNSYRCGFDALWIHDGSDSTSSTLGGPWCGHHGGYNAHTGEVSYHWTSTQSSGSEVLVRFVTGNGTRSGRGFRLTWKAACEKTIEDDEGVIESPNYPNEYPDNMHCTYKFERYKIKPGYYFNISFTAFSLEAAVDGACVNDYVEILQETRRPPENSLWHFKRYCGDTLPERLAIYNSFKIRFVSNSNGQSTGFRLEHQILKAECGPSVLPAPSGEVTSPGYPGTFPSYTTCTQTLQVEEGNTITAIVHLVDLSYGYYSGIRECSQTHDVYYGAVLSVFDGNNTENETLLTRVCGTTYTTYSVTFNTSEVTVLFASGDNEEYQRGFSASYFVTPNGNDCGQEDLTEPTGEIGLPSYEDSWLTGVCVWNITVSPGHRVQLTIDVFHLYRVQPSDHEDCTTSDSTGHLEIHQPSDQNGGYELLALFCHHFQPSMMRSTSNSLLVKLILPQDTKSSPISRLSAHYMAVQTQDVETCGYEVTENSGQLSSPDYPNHYGDGLECRWLITVDPGYAVRLAIYDIDIEVKESHVSSDKRYFTCGADSLRIHDGDGELSPVIGGPWCGRHEPSSRHVTNVYSWKRFSSSSNTVLVKFVSDNWGSGRGFNLTWSADCSHTIRNEEGTIVSPKYPHRYPDNMYCEYKFDQHRFASFTITFTPFSLEEGENGKCTNDYVEINGYDENSNQFSDRFCGSSAPGSWTLNTPIYITFVSNKNTASGGFQLTYKRVGSGPGNCTKLIGDDGGTIESPNFPGSYPDDTQCSFYFVHDYVSFLITFTSFSLEVGENGTCTADYLQIKQFGDQEYSEVLCGRTVPDNRTLNSPFEMHFVTNDHTTGGGFQLTYQRTAYRDCGGSQSGTQGELQSPLYPAHYLADTECTWLLTAPPHHKVRLSFRHFDLQETETGTCQQDFVVMRDGSSRWFPVLSQVCGGSIPLDVTSTGNVMFVQFISDMSVSGTGFSAEWFAVCEKTYRDARGTLEYSSSRYNAGKGLESQCTYLIDLWKQDDIIHLTVNSFTVADLPPDCYGTYIEIRDGGFEGASLLGRVFCDTELPAVYTSSRNMMWVRFVSDGSSDSTEFQASYTTETPSQSVCLCARTV